MYFKVLDKLIFVVLKYALHAAIIKKKIKVTNVFSDYCRFPELSLSYCW